MSWSTSCWTPGFSPATGISDVQVEYAKASPEDVLIRITATNRGRRSRRPSTSCPPCGSATPARGAPPDAKPSLRRGRGVTRGTRVIAASHPTLGRRWLYVADKASCRCCSPRTRRTASCCSGGRTPTPVKDGIGEFVVHGRADVVAAEPAGTKASVYGPDDDCRRPDGGLEAQVIGRGAAGRHVAIFRLRRNVHRARARGGRVLSIDHARIGER